MIIKKYTYSVLLCSHKRYFIHRRTTSKIKFHHNTWMDMIKTLPHVLSPLPFSLHLNIIFVWFIRLVFWVAFAFARFGIRCHGRIVLITNIHKRYDFPVMLSIIFRFKRFQDSICNLKYTFLSQIKSHPKNARSCANKNHTFCWHQSSFYPKLHL